MRTRAVGLAGLVVVAIGAGAPAQPAAGLPKPVTLHGHDLRVRKAGEQDWKAAARIGVELVRDSATGAVIIVTQKGNIAVAPGAATPPGPDKTAKDLFARDLRARRADEAQFAPTTAKFGVEAFKDLATGKLIFISEAATVALADPPPALAADRDPAWHHSLILKVRAAGEAEFSKATKAYGLEAYKDPSTGGLVYVTDGGAIATAPAPAQPPAPDKIKPPAHLYGLILHARRPDEPEFTKDTRRVAVEVFRDDNAGQLVYVSDAGAIATAPLPAAPASGQGVQWRHSFVLAARPGLVKEFQKANKYGVEVFRDNNSGHLVYVTDTGSIAVLPQK